MVRFSKDDLASTVRFAPADSIFGSFDLVLCRNILIYFSLALQGRVLEKLHRSLSKGGYLILGDSDGLNKTMEQQFNIVNGRNRVFRKP
jgi:chemotaxis methyl-accepting protein methylase